MVNDPWFPINYKLPNGPTLIRMLNSGVDWQIYRLKTTDTMLVVKKNLAERWVARELIITATLNSISFGGMEYETISSEPQLKLEPVADNHSSKTKTDVLAFAVSLRKTRELDAESSFHDAIFVEKLARLLPTWSVSENSSDAEVLGQWLTGGISIPATSIRRLTSLVPWFDQNDLTEFIETAGLCKPSHFSYEDNTKLPTDKEIDHSRQTAESSDQSDDISSGQNKYFSLPGRQMLEDFFNEYVIDIVQNAERYKALGIEFPSAIVLHGPPGCGKTFAVERLIEHLDWPIYFIDPNSVNSPFIHETSKKVGEVFDQAIDSAPSAIVIDEMESYLSDRETHGSSGHHHVEEVAEFLRRIPTASKHQVLVIGMTNRIEMIDSAILRRGRFDHILNVGMPSATEVSALVDSLLTKLPISGELDKTSCVDKLTGRPLSDVAFVLRDAARLAARSGKNQVDDDSLQKALASLPSLKPTQKPIGFIQD